MRAMTVGSRIKQIRIEAGLSQEEFADRLSANLPEEKAVTRGAVGNWERGKGIKRTNLEMIARVFGYSLEWLSLGRGLPRAGFDVPDAKAAEIEKLNSLYLTLDEKAQLVLMQMAETIARTAARQDPQPLEGASPDHQPREKPKSS